MLLLCEVGKVMDRRPGRDFLGDLPHDRRKHRTATARVSARRALRMPRHAAFPRPRRLLPLAARKRPRERSHPMSSTYSSTARSAFAFA